MNVIKKYKKYWIHIDNEQRFSYNKNIQKYVRNKKEDVNMKKIVNVKRFIIGNTILLLLIVMIVSSIFNIAYSYNNIKYKTVYVTQGDTLWKIAEVEQKNNSYYKDKDIRDIVYDIKNTNSLNVSNLTVGQELKIPTR